MTLNTAVCLMALPLFSQVSITGPTCAASGVVYQYTITGQWDSASTMQVCISGGLIADSSNVNTCSPAGGLPLSSVLVVWNSPSGGSLTLTSTAGSASLNVSITQPLQAGTIDSSAAAQTIGFDSVPATLTCSADAGGACSPAYADQWQQSPDMLVWSDIPGATGQNLGFSSPLAQTTFFRRKVTESSSGTIAYSNAASVLVYAQPVQAGSTDSSSSSQDSLANNNLSGFRYLNSADAVFAGSGNTKIPYDKMPFEKQPAWSRQIKTGLLN